MLMASFITIPLYKLLCNLSYIDAITTLYPKVLTVHKFECNWPVVGHEHSNLCFMSCLINNLQIYSNTRLGSIEFTQICTALLRSQLPTADALFEVLFFSRVSNFSLLEFTSLQERLTVYPGETGMIFFRLYNPTIYDMSGVSLYLIYPSNISVYINKIQCFCFDLISIRNNETVELPVLFFVDKKLLYDNALFDKMIYIYYVFFTK